METKSSKQHEKRQIRVLALAIFGLTSVMTVIRYIRRGIPEGVPVMFVVVGIALLLVLISLVSPDTLRPAYRAWMVLARALGWFVTRLFLSVFFYVMITPIAIVMRLLGKRPLDLDFTRRASTYWVEKAHSEEQMERYTRQY